MYLPFVTLMWGTAAGKSNSGLCTDDALGKR